MNIDATEDELRAVAEVLKLAAILDDRAPAGDKARIAAWAEKIHQHRLGRADLVDGLQAFYDSPSERAMQIGDLIHFAKQVRRDRVEREETEQREARRVAVDEKAADEVHSIAAGFVPGPTPHTDRVAKAKIALQCCNGKNESQAAIKEFFVAKTAAVKGGTK